MAAATPSLYTEKYTQPSLISIGVNSSLGGLISEDEDYNSARNLLIALAVNTNSIPPNDLYKRLLKLLKDPNTQDTDVQIIITTLGQLHALHPHPRSTNIWRPDGTADWNFFYDAVNQIANATAATIKQAGRCALIVKHFLLLLDEESAAQIPEDNRLLSKMIAASGDKASKRNLLDSLMAAIGNSLAPLEETPNFFPTSIGLDVADTLVRVLYHLFDTEGTAINLADLRFDLWVAFKELPYTAKMLFFQVLDNPKHKVDIINFFLEKFDTTQVPKTYHSLQASHIVTYEKIVHVIYNLLPVSIQTHHPRRTIAPPTTSASTRRTRSTITSTPPSPPKKAKIIPQPKENPAELFAHMVYHLVKAWITIAKGSENIGDLYKHTEEFEKRVLDECEGEDESKAVRNVTQQLLCIINTQT